MEAVIIPRPNLSPDEAIQLGEAIKTFLNETDSQESGWSVFSGCSAINDLIAGEMPKPMRLVGLAAYRMLKKSFSEDMSPMASCDLPDLPNVQMGSLSLGPDTCGVFLTLSPSLGTDKDATITLLNRFLPRESIADIEIK
jgi:hypothetical protein